MFLLKKLIEIFVKLVAAFILVYVVFVLGFVWWHCYTSQLEGGANGKLDAYRHTFASAVVTFTTSPKLVKLVTKVMERKNRPANLMDQHNNAIGIRIGQQVKTLDEINAKVVAQVANGAVNATEATQTTWLHPRYWGPGFLW